MLRVSALTVFAFTLAVMPGALANFTRPVWASATNAPLSRMTLATGQARTMCSHQPAEPPVTAMIAMPASWRSYKAW